MADLTAIREAIAAALEVSFGDSMQISAEMLSNPTPPSAHVFPDETDYHKAMGNGAEDWNLIVQVFVATTSDIGAQRLLDSMLASTGAGSVKAAIEADRTLGGLVSGLKVRKTSGYRVYQRALGDPLLGADWHLTVLV